MCSLLSGDKKLRRKVKAFDVKDAEEKVKESIVFAKVKELPPNDVQELIDDMQQFINSI